jgi:transcriptional regulator with GAF, ATPase, and Fis domain
MVAKHAISWCCIPSAIDKDVIAILARIARAEQGVREWEPTAVESLADTVLVFLGDTDLPTLVQLQTISRERPGRVLAVLRSQIGELPLGETMRLLALGVGDVIPLKSIGNAGELVLAVLARWNEIDTIVSSDLIVKNVVGRSRAWTRLMRQVVDAARFSQSPVLVTGDTGTGKELIARLIHSLDPARKTRDLIVVDCTTLSPELTGSELFGHERGAFTGAVSAREGAFALANRGTLFLDEIGDLPLSLQGQLLRTLQEKVYKSVGGNAWRSTDFRLVCATNRDLKDEVNAHRFRSDLFHRIAGVTCRTPPLRERVEDIPALASHFLREALNGQSPPPLVGAILEYVVSRTYDGNVRDLRLLMHSIARGYLGTGCITVGGIPEDQRPTSGASDPLWRDEMFEQAIRRAVLLGAPLKDIGKAAEETAVRFVLSDAESTGEAARRLGVTTRAVQARRRAARPAS